VGKSSSSVEWINGGFYGCCTYGMKTRGDVALLAATGDRWIAARAGAGGGDDCMAVAVLVGGCTTPTFSRPSPLIPLGVGGWGLGGGGGRECKESRRPCGGFPGGDFRKRNVVVQSLLGAVLRVELAELELLFHVALPVFPVPVGLVEPAEALVQRPSRPRTAPPVGVAPARLRGSDPSWPTPGT